MRVTTEKELAKAIESDTEFIEIEGDLAKGVIKLKYVGKAAWLVAIAAIGAAVALVLATPATAGITSGFAAVSAAGAVSILGLSATTAIGIAVATGGISVLNRLRDYDMEKISDTHVKLTKA